MTNLITSNCTNKPELLAESDIKKYLEELVDWDMDTRIGTGIISHQFSFKNYYKTLAFINAVAWIVHQEDHHPDIEFGYNKCTVSFSTHSVNGLSINDFICAAKIKLLITT